MKIHIKIYPWMRNLQSWCQRMKAWETPAWWPSFLKTDRTEPLVVTPAQYKKLVRGCAVAVVVIVIAAGIGIYEFVSLQQAKAMVNDRGGLLGKPVQLVSVDNHGKPEDAVAAIQQLTVRHVSAIIGPDLADCTRAVIPNVEAVKIPLISPACTQPDITVDAQSHEVYRYIFRAAYIDASQGRAMADYALKQLHVKRAAVFYYPDKMYAQGLAEYFRSAFAASGGDVPVYIPVENVLDLTKYLPLLQREQVDVIYLPGYDDWTIPAIELLRSHGVSLPLLGPDGWNGPKMERDVAVSYTHLTLPTILLV